MRIAQVVAPWLPVPPKGYGGIEAVVHELTEELVARGHHVTLFATGDSRTKAHLSFFYKTSLGNNGEIKNNPHTLLEQIFPVFTQAENFDIIHCHDIPHALFFAEFIKTPVVHTLHGSLMENEQDPQKHAIYSRFTHQNFVSISNSQRKGLPGLHYIATVYNGIKIEDITVGHGDGGYLAWIGRINPKKGVVEAIESAKLAGMPIKIAAFIDKQDKPYFDKFVLPRIDGKNVQFIGEIGEKEKNDLLGHAFACLFPIKWHEPFGLVMVESLACGTPVVAIDAGSVSEIIENGKNGFVVAPTHPLTNESWEVDTASIPGITEKVKILQTMENTTYQEIRAYCRSYVERKFTIQAMVDGYEKVYSDITAAHGRTYYR